MAVPNIFASATSAIPLSQLDTNFATAITLGNTAVYLGNTTTSLGNVTLTNVTISSGNVTVTGANVSGTANVSTLIVTGNQTSLGNVAITGNVSANIATFGAGSNTSPAITTTGDTNTGIFFPAADQVAITTGGTQRAVVDASGNVGIGTSSPSSAISVSRSTGEAVISITNAGSASSWLTLAPSSSGNAYIHNTSNVATIFTTNGTERMRIDSSGNLLVGTTSIPSIGGVSSSSGIARSATDATWTWFAQNTAASGGARGIAINYSGQTPNSTTSEALFFNDSTAARFYVRSNGGIGNYSANNVNLSDRREKTNFAPAGSYLTKICAIPVQTFNYIDQNLDEDDGLTLGVVAQDVQAVAPELVSESNWGTEENPKMRLSIYQTDMQYALMKCIQEQQALILSLTDRITALETK